MFLGGDRVAAPAAVPVLEQTGNRDPIVSQVRARSDQKQCAGAVDVLGQAVQSLGNHLLKECCADDGSRKNDRYAEG